MVSSVSRAGLAMGANRKATMTRPPGLEAILDELKPFLDRPPEPGSADEVRVKELLGGIAHPSGEQLDPEFARRLALLQARIEAVETRREAERHAHDLAPGRESLTPMVGWDFRHD